MLTILPILFCITTSQCLVTPKFSLVSCLGECHLSIDLALRQFLAMNSVGSGLVNYSCYMDDICSIFELDLPWTKPYLAFILFSRLCKGFQPRLSFWKEDLEDAEENGMVLFVRECLQGTSRIKSRVKQLITPLEGRECCEADLLLDEWMKKLLSSEDSGAHFGYGTDPVVEMAVTMFASLMALALQIDNKEEQMREATEAALDKRIDLSALLPACKECVLEIQDGGRPILYMDNGNGRFSHELTASEMNRLSFVLSGKDTTAEQKRSQVAVIVGGIALSGQMARNYEQGMERYNGQGENLQMR